MESVPLLDCAGRRRSPVTLSSFHQGRVPRNKGRRYPPDPPSVEEIIAVMRACGSRSEGLRLRAIIVVLWRAGLRISEALALSEGDLDGRGGAVLVRCGKGGKRREVGVDRWAWEQLDVWLELRAGPPAGALFCPPERCSAWCAARPVVARARRPGSAASCITPRWRLGSVGGSRPTNSDTRTRWRCPAKGSRCW